MRLERDIGTGNTRIVYTQFEKEMSEILSKLHATDDNKWWWEQPWWTEVSRLKKLAQDELSDTEYQEAISEVGR